jgi:uncharacterized protein YdhG (YjbR/CyaY superfamily)
MARTNFTSVAEYIATQPKEARGVLKRVRQAIRKAVPKAEEVVSYQIPAYKVNGRVFIYFGGWKQHYSVYPATKRLVAAFKKELGPYEVNNKGTVRFPLSQPVPVKLIAALAKFRAQEVAGSSERASEPKTRLTKASPAAFIKRVADERRRRDCQELLRLMQQVTGDAPKMWGSSIVGFGRYRYKYATGREGESLLTGFSPRKQNLVLYLGPGIENKDLMARLGKHKTGKGCLYLTRLDDVDRNVLRRVVEESVAIMRKQSVAK